MEIIPETKYEIVTLSSTYVEELENAFEKVSRVVDITQDEFKALESHIRNVSNEITISFDLAAKALREIIDNLNKQNKGLS